MNNQIIALLLGLLALASCNKENLSDSQSSAASSTLTAVAQTSGELASGTSFRIAGTTTDSSNAPGPHGPGGGGPHHPGTGGMLPGTNLLAPTNQLLAIIDAESAGDVRGMELHAHAGATITNFDSIGNVISLPLPGTGGPQGCSFSGGQYPHMDSLLLLIAKTEIDFGSGVSIKHDTTTITRKGKITITRTHESSGTIETVTFDNYSVNDNLIEGTKVRTTTRTQSGSTLAGHSTTVVTDGKITFNDGVVATWTSSRTRASAITVDSDGRPSTGEITTEGSVVVAAGEGELYSHRITKTLTENVACGPHRPGPVSGTIEIVYQSNKITLDFGDGSCDNQTLTITINGVTTTKTFGF